MTLSVYGLPLTLVGFTRSVKSSHSSSALPVTLPMTSAVSWARIEPTGHVRVYTGISPHGQGSETTLAQIAADALGVTPADVQVLHGDTDDLPAGGGTSGSRGLIAGSSAIHGVLQEARQTLLVLATHLLDCRPEEVVFQDGRVYAHSHPERHLPFARLAAAAYDEAQLPPGVALGLDFGGSHTLPASPYAFGAHVA